MRCPCCGGVDFTETSILGPRLISAWDLSPEEAEYRNRSEGLTCTRCNANVRTMTLALAIMRAFGYQGLFRDFPLARPGLRVLEVNPAARLTNALRKFEHRTLVEYPDVDLLALPFADETFDLVVHSDTLEHVARSTDGLRESRRVLRTNGWLCYTVPIVVGRLTRQREGGESISYHGLLDDPAFPVVTEYGADAWCEVFAAGFEHLTISTLAYPAGLAISAQRSVAESPRASPARRLASRCRPENARANVRDLGKLVRRTLRRK